MNFNKTDPTLVYIFGFKSIKQINDELHDLLKDVVKLDDIQNVDQHSRFIINNMEYIEKCKAMQKQVFVIADSIQCIPEHLRNAANHVFASSKVCKCMPLYGIWLNNDNGTFTFV